MANDAVVTTPIAASAPIRRPPATRPIVNAASTPHSPAPRRYDTPITDEIAAPPNTARDRP